MIKEKMDYRRIILSGVKGKFSVCTQLFSPMELMELGPVVLLEELLRRLQISHSDIDMKKTYHSFYMWLIRWRKKNKALLDIEKHKKEGEKAIKDISLSKKIKVNNFEFTDPATVKKSDGPIIKIVK